MSGHTTRQLKSRLLAERTRHSRHAQLKPGDVLQERYEIIGILGVGGFSCVYKARDLRFPQVTRICAIKEMINLATDPQLREIAVRSFEREAGILATLKHPAIPDVYDYFTEADRGYLVLEFIQGKDLDTLIAESPAPPPVETVLDWAAQICEVLTYLHARKPQPVVFRDLKPSNLMLDVRRRIHIIDFNIAKVFQQDAKHTMMGTEGYSPPEQYRGEASPAGDIYALGATLHHLLTGQDPRMEVPFSFAERPIHAVNPQVPPRFVSIINRCLAYDPAERYADAMALAEALRSIGPAGVNGSEPAADAEGQAPGQAAAAAATPTMVAPDSAGSQPLWRFRCEDEVRANPVVAQGLVFVGAYDNNLYALKADKGEFVWKFPAGDGIAGMPEIHKQLLFVGAADGYLYCLKTATGRQNWRFKAGGPIYSSPKVAFDHVFFGCDDGHLYAVNIHSGRLAWKAVADYAVRSTPFVGEEHVFIGTEGGTVQCIDLGGNALWQFQARRAVTSTPLVAEEMVFLGSMDNTVYALDASSGWAIWRFRTKRPVISSPAIDDGVVYIGSADGNLYALDMYSGRQKWAYQTEGQVTSSPAVANGSVYFGSTDGHVYCLSARKGELLWRFATEGYVVSSPVVVDGIVYVGSTDRHLYALPA